MYKIQRYLFILILLGTYSAFAQQPTVTKGKSRQASINQPSRSASKLQSGPMVGYSDMREVMLWAQTKEPAKVQIRYHETGKAAPVYLTNEVQTTRQAAFTAHLLADQVEPGRTYEYDVLIGGQKVSLPYPTQFQTQSLWQWRTDPPTFRFGVGSCTYVNEPDTDRPGKPYGGGYEIFTAMAAQKPDFMLWTGDNTYTRETDWNSRTGVLRRYTHTRSLPEMQPLLASTHNYATWDDHDYGPNDADRSYWLKPVTLEAFKLFWANPNFVFPEGCAGTFFWNDCQFFLLDDRTFRAPNDMPDGPEKAYFGDKQIQWLLDALTFSQAPFKFIVTGGQIINPTKAFENYSIYGTERDRLLKAIADAKIPGVLFITGDRHHSILHKLDRPGTYPIYDLTVSPLTSSVAQPRADELKQPTYVDGTLVTERNFGLLSVSGPLKDRVLTIKVYDQKGAERWSRDIRANELK
ncbi:MULTISPECIES: alkaline phosphatase [unclassified Spirosoma]|uniref:alkaline phosphatase D family protein n=1 Tax=unclassified Spirosoma TaxID=2621999 RepID=UPI00096698FC|nr:MULTISPECIES: alkaline phosphatase D family protein [unclassified Spirosoma]MBN8826451.1 alkaline phosphatase family protein [Spirosoma sp.]OJW75840.1 MAG: phosphodiesterase [Spirosoma sp. 48-14]